MDILSVLKIEEKDEKCFLVFMTLLSLLCVDVKVLALYVFVYSECYLCIIFKMFMCNEHHREERHCNGILF